MNDKLPHLKFVVYIKDIAKMRGIGSAEELAQSTKMDVSKAKRIWDSEEDFVEFSNIGVLSKFFHLHPKFFFDYKLQE